MILNGIAFILLWKNSYFKTIASESEIPEEKIQNILSNLMLILRFSVKLSKYLQNVLA